MPQPLRHCSGRWQKALQVHDNHGRNAILYAASCTRDLQAGEALLAAWAEWKTNQCRAEKTVALCEAASDGVANRYPDSQSNSLSPRYDAKTKQYD